MELLDRAAEIRSRADAARAKARALIPALFLDTFGDAVSEWPIASVERILAARATALAAELFDARPADSDTATAPSLAAD